MKQLEEKCRGPEIVIHNANCRYKMYDVDDRDIGCFQNGYVLTFTV